ncbi:MAG: S-layer homology domain-containing protein [Bacillota bacterium]
MAQLLPAFSDVPENHWAANYIKIAVALGLVRGYPDGTFRPEQPVTRAEGTVLAVRTLGIGALVAGLFALGAYVSAVYTKPKGGA